MKRSFQSSVALGVSHANHALVSLKLRPGQSLFSLGGLMVGVFSFLAANSVIHGFTIALSESMAEQGAGVFRIRRERRDMDSTAQQETSFRPPLTERELETVSRALGDDAQVASEVWDWNNAVSRGSVTTASTVPVVGASSEFLDANGMKLQSGRPLTALDLKHRRRVAVIGHSIVKKLFPAGAQQALGQEILLWGERFEVVGTVERAPTEYGLGQPGKNMMVVIPSSVFVERQGNRSLFITVRLLDPDRLADSVARAVSDLRVQRKLGAGKPDDFVVTDNRDLAELQQGMSLLLGGVASFISGLLLIISGIGISNVLLASLYQRRSEIGLRMALGATPSSIRWQFLVEATLWAFSGGAMGCLLSALFIVLFRRFTGYPVEVSGELSAFALAACSTVGLVSGLIPAARASLQMPSEAIRVR